MDINRIDGVYNIEEPLVVADKRELLAEDVSLGLNYLTPEEQEALKQHFIKVIETLQGKTRKENDNDNT